jgi:L-amino acid N-acyltransferase YncA
MTAEPVSPSPARRGPSGMAPPMLRRSGSGTGDLTTGEITSRLATLDDAAAIAGIYNNEVLTSTVTFDLVPRSLDDQRTWLATRSGAYAAIVAVADESLPGTGEVVGFASLSPYKERAAYSTSVDNSVYVHPDHQGRGIGKLLLGELVDTARSHGFHAVFARIVGGHDASIRLHEKFGFQRVGVEREVGRKFGQWLDVVLMQRLL